MSGKVDIRLGPLDALRWAWGSFCLILLGALGLIPDEIDGRVEFIAPFLTVLFWPVAAWLGYLAARSWLWLRSGKVMVTLSEEGLRAHECGDVLVPWSMVVSVRRVTHRPATFMYGLTLQVILDTTDPFAHDAYEVEYDREVAGLGVKTALPGRFGLEMIPARLSFSSAELARAFATWLPPERCLDFENRVDPADVKEFSARLGRTVTVAMQTAEVQKAVEGLLHDMAEPSDGGSKP